LRRDGWPVRPAAGHALNFEFDTTGRLAGVRYEADEHADLVMRRVGSTLRGTTERIAVRTTLARADFVVRRDLRTDALTAGIPDAVAAQFAHAFGPEWNPRQVRRGDRVRLVYERRLGREGRSITPGKIVAAEIAGHGPAQQAFLYNEAGTESYVDEHGRILTRSFLRYPVEFTRITSVFTEERFHPILHETRPHNGVDLAAPVGTPVYAAADGVVSWADRYAGYGNHIAIDHGDGFVSTYSHLHGIARSIRPGTVVRQGDVIGSVGSTGL
jgi:murein DD-endopeptidase MepM/ murein hydrolase activator NlpD